MSYTDATTINEAFEAICADVTKLLVKLNKTHPVFRLTPHYEYLKDGEVVYLVYCKMIDQDDIH